MSEWTINLSSLYIYWLHNPLKTSRKARTNSEAWNYLKNTKFELCKWAGFFLFVLLFLYQMKLLKSSNMHRTNHKNPAQVDTLMSYNISKQY